MPRFLYSTFTGTDLASASSITNESGGTWVDLVLIAQLKSGAAVKEGGLAVCRATEQAATADYEVFDTAVFDGYSFSWEGAGALARVQDANNWYIARLFIGSGPALVARLQKRVGGTDTWLGAGNITIAASLPAAGTTYKLAIRVEGSTIKLLVNDVEQQSVTDTSITAKGYPGIAVNAANTRSDGIAVTAVEGWDIATTPNPMNLGALSTTAAASASVSSSAWAAQSARPTADVSAGTWTASAGGSLFAAIDEVTADDADYISYTATGTCRVRFGALSDPGSDPNPVRVSYRIAGDGSAGQTVKLYSSTTLIATWTHSPAPATATTYTQTLTSGQRSAITNWNLLELEVTGS